MVRKRLRRASWPSEINSRAQWCAVAQASRPDEARRKPGEKRQDLAASQPLAHHFSARLVDRVNLKDTLCQIKTNSCNIAHGWLPLLVIFDDHHPGTSMPSGGPSTPSVEPMNERRAHDSACDPRLLPQLP